MYLPFEEYREAVLYYYKNDVSVHIHAMGDSTISNIVSIFEEAERTYPESKAMLHLGHAWMLSEKDIDRLEKLQSVSVNFSPMLAIPHPQMELFITIPLGMERHQEIFPGKIYY